MFPIMNREPVSSGRRTYSSKLREEQAESTRERILAGLCELLGAGDVEDLSVPKVAEHAGVSVPTVYRYFPSRKDLFDGLEVYLSREMHAPPFPGNWQKL